MLRFTLSVWVPQAEKHRGIEPAAQPQSSLRLTAFPARDTHVAKQRKVSEPGAAHTTSVSEFFSTPSAQGFMDALHQTRLGQHHRTVPRDGVAECLDVFPGPRPMTQSQAFPHHAASFLQAESCLQASWKLMDLQHRLRAQVRRHARPSDIRFGVARLRSTSDWSVLPDRRSVRSGAARLRSTSDSRFHPILVPELVAVVIEEVLERVRAAIARNAALLCAHNGGTATGPGRGRALRLSTSSTSNI